MIEEEKYELVDYQWVDTARAYRNVQENDLCFVLTGHGRFYCCIYDEQDGFVELMTNIQIIDVVKVNILARWKEIEKEWLS